MLMEIQAFDGTDRPRPGYNSHLRVASLRMGVFRNLTSSTSKSVQHNAKTKRGSDYFSPVFCAGGHNVNPCCVNAAVSQNIGQLGDVFLNATKSPGKQLAKIVWKHFTGFYSRCLAEGFHLRPDITPIQQLPVPGNKDCSGTDAIFLCVIQKHLF